jgi:hypothetical protein
LLLSHKDVSVFCNFLHSMPWHESVCTMGTAQLCTSICISNTHPSPPYRMSWSNYPLCPRNPPPPPPILSLKPIVIFRNSWFSVPRIYLLMAVKVKLKPHNGMIFLGPVFVSVEIVPQGCFTGRQRIRGEATSRVLELSLDKYG